MPRSFSTVRHLPLLIVLILAAALSGCQAIGAVGYKLFGEGKDPAEYTPPKDQPMLVLVENYEHPQDIEQPSEQLAGLITDKLKEQKVAPMIEQEKLLALREERPAEYARMKITDIGRAMGAKQILYVNLKRCSVEGAIGSEDLRGSIDATARMIDVDSGQTKWPVVGDGKDFTATTDYSRNQAKDAETTIRNSMLDDLSDAITLLFYQHEAKGGPPEE
jgi:hypothetical protein